MIKLLIYVKFWIYKLVECLGIALQGFHRISCDLPYQRRQVLPFKNTLLIIISIGLVKVFQILFLFRKLQRIMVAEFITISYVLYKVTILVKVF